MLYAFIQRPNQKGKRKQKQDAETSALCKTMAINEKQWEALQKLTQKILKETKA